MTANVNADGYSIASADEVSAAGYGFVPAFYAAASFDGASYIQNASPSNLPVGAAARTISAWINPSNVGTYYATICGWGSVGTNGEMCTLCIKDGYLYFVGWDADAQGTIPITANTPYHVVVTYDGNVTLKLYVNGVLDSTTTLSTPLNTVNNYTHAPDGSHGREGISIGSIWPAAWAYFQGAIEEIQIFNTALPATGALSIASLYNGGAGYYGSGSESGLVTGYHLNGDATDFSTSGNNGTWYGRTAYVAVWFKTVL